MGDKWLGIAPWSEALSIVFSPLRHGAASPSPNIENERGKPPPRGRAHCCSNMSLARRGIWNLGLAHPWQQLHPEHHCLLAPYFCMRNKNALLWRGKGRKKTVRSRDGIDSRSNVKKRIEMRPAFSSPTTRCKCHVGKKEPKKGHWLAAVYHSMMLGRQPSSLICPVTPRSISVTTFSIPPASDTAKLLQVSPPSENVPCTIQVSVRSARVRVGRTRPMRLKTQPHVADGVRPSGSERTGRSWPAAPHSWTAAYEQTEQSRAGQSQGKKKKKKPPIG